MREQNGIDILEHARAYEIRLRADELFRNARPDLDRAGNPVSLHDALQRDSGGDVHGLPGVVTFTVTRRARDQWIVIRDARLLRCLGNSIDVRTERDYGLARAPGGEPRGWNPGKTALHREAVLLQ